MIRLWSKKQETLPTGNIQATAEVEILAADADKPATIRIKAYTDRQEMNIPGFGRVAVALEGMALGENLPLLTDHQNKINAVAGSGTPRIESGQLIVEGIIARDSEAGKQILSLHKAGVKLEASIGAKPTAAAEYIRATETKHGITATQDLRYFPATQLQEVSLTPIGAASGTTVEIAASHGGDMPTTFDPEAHDADVIERLCANDKETYLQAIGEQWSIKQTKEHQLEKERAGRPSGPGIRASGGGDAMSSEIFEASLMIHAAGESHAAACYGEQTVERARHHRQGHILDYFKTAIVANGGTVGSSASKEAIIGAALNGQGGNGVTIQAASAFSTFSVPTALGNMQHKSLMQAYATAPASWENFVTPKSVTDFKENRGIRPVMDEELLPLSPSGEINHTTIDEKTIGTKLATFARMITVTRHDLINDDTGFLADIPQGLGRTAKRTTNRTAWRAIASNVDFDGNAVFTAGNGNLLTGAGSALSFTSIRDAVAKMRLQESEDGEPLDISPTILVVSDALEFEARQLLNSTTLSRDLNQDQEGTANPIPPLELRVEPRLSKTDKYKNVDPANWYLFSAPANGAVYYVTLNGHNGPMIENERADFNVLGHSWRAVHDHNFWLGDHRAAVKSEGA